MWQVFYFYPISCETFSFSLFLQVIYLAIIGGTYYLVVNSTFNYIPGHYMGGYHRYKVDFVAFAFPFQHYRWYFFPWTLYILCRYTSLLGVGVGIILFLLTSFSDPGTINADNVTQYISVYPYDNLIYSEKECSTCKILKYVHYFLRIIISVCQIDADHFLQFYVFFSIVTQTCSVQALQHMRSLCCSVWPSLWMDGLTFLFNMILFVIKKNLFH